MSDDGTNQRAPGVRQDDIVLEFARRALGGQRVSREAWIAACRVAETAIRVARDLVPVDQVEQIFLRVISLSGLKLVNKEKYDELLVALNMFGMRSYPTDSAALRRVKKAYEDVKWSDDRVRVPADVIRDGLPLPPLPLGERE